VEASLLLCVHSLTKTYRSGLIGCTANVHALSDVSIEIHRGEIVGLIGASGSGKTTLLLCVARLLCVDDGIIDCRGRAMYFRDVLHARGSQSDIALVDNGDLVRGDVTASFALVSLVERARATGAGLVIASREDWSIRPIANRILRLERGRLTSLVPPHVARVAEESLR
jgi:ABC-type sugar transport system ATPase subunit